MFIELVDSLRCLAAHEDTWLVAAVTRMDARHIVDGTLGCPVCRREYVVLDGVGWFPDDRPGIGPEHLTTVALTADSARHMRAAALLGLVDPGGIVCLGGAWADCADALAELGAAHVVTVNARAEVSGTQTVSALAIGDRFPFAAGGLRAVALDRDTATPGRLTSAAALLRSRGRLVGPASAAVPDGLIELARDAEDWVAEMPVVASPPIPLRSVRR